jgi:hypothetical protein
MSDELTPEREKYLIEQVARYIVKHDLEDFAQILLEGTAPCGEIVGELGFMMSYPLAVTFFGRTGSDFINMMGFNYKLNAKRILDRVAELKEEKKRLEEKWREEERLKGKGKGWFSRLFSRPMSKRNPE